MPVVECVREPQAALILRSERGSRPALVLRSERGSRPALILRSGPKDRVSKDEGGHLTMRASVSKGEGGLMLRDAHLRWAPQHEAGQSVEAPC
jgi:hypothetical protein